MRANQTRQLLSLLKDNQGKRNLSSFDIATILKISRRQVQKYIADLNAAHPEMPIIISDNDEYGVNPQAVDIIEQICKKGPEAESPESRRTYILQKVLNSTDVFDLTDFSNRLFVSEATIEADLKKIRQKVEAYDLKLQSSGGKVYLNGPEKNKRALMRTILFQTGAGLFSLEDAVGFLSLSYDLAELYQILREVFNKYEIFVNDYALHNVALHIVIMIERLRNKRNIEDHQDFSSLIDKSQVKAVREIFAFLEDRYDIKTTEAELYNMVLLISNNSSLTNYAIINAQNIENYIDVKYIDIARYLFSQIEEVYHLDKFDEEFIATFTIHIKNLFLRQKKQVTIENPLTNSVKIHYPFIYDIAVFMAQILEKKYKITIDEDEIAFLSFHVGSFFENNSMNTPKVKCLFVYSDYYGYYQNQIKRLTELFKEEINIIAALPYTVAEADIRDIDLIISMTDGKYQTRYVVINPFITASDIKKLRKVIDELIKKKQMSVLHAGLSELFHEDIFYPDLICADDKEAIEFLSQDVIAKSYADADFTKDVLHREKLSPTVYNGVAIPHCLTDSVTESFISFAICKTPLRWADRTVDMVVLIGITDESRHLFARVFDSLVDVLSDPLQIAKFTQAKDYHEFLSLMQDALNTQEST